MQWFVLKAANNRALKIKEELFNKKIISYVPMTKTIITNRNGVKKITNVPIFSNLIFIKTTHTTIKEINQNYHYLYFLYNKINGKNIPMVVPTHEMDQFIDFVGGNEDKIERIDFDKIDLKKGELVKITSGAFEGKTATFVKVKGKRNKQIVAVLDGMIAVMATSTFTIEKI